MGWAREKCGHALRAPGDREAVKAVAADVPLLAPLRRDRIDGRLWGKRGVTGRSEGRDLWEVRTRLHCRVDGRGGRCVGKGRESLQLVDLSMYGGVDDDWVVEAMTAVNDAMCDGVDHAGS